MGAGWAPHDTPFSVPLVANAPGNGKATAARSQSLAENRGHVRVLSGGRALSGSERRVSWLDASLGKHPRGGVVAGPHGSEHHREAPPPIGKPRARLCSLQRRARSARFRREQFHRSAELSCKRRSRDLCPENLSNFDGSSGVASPAAESHEWREAMVLVEGGGEAVVVSFQTARSYCPLLQLSSTGWLWWQRRGHLRLHGVHLR